MSSRASKQGSVTFHDVAVYFSEEEWGHLQEWQKELYRNVVEEVHTALLSLGYTIANPDVLVHLRKEEEQHLRACRDSHGRETLKEKSTASFPIITPDILLRIKQKDEPSYKNNRCSVGREKHHSSSDYPVIASVGFKNEPDTYDDNSQDDLEDESCIITSPESYSWTKTAGAPYPNHLRNCAGRERDNCSMRNEARLRRVDGKFLGGYSERGSFRMPFSGKANVNIAQRSDKGSTGLAGYWSDQYPGKTSRQRMETAALIQRHFTKIAIPVVQHRRSANTMPTLYREPDGTFRIGSPPGKPGGTGLYSCHQCDKNFDRPSELKIHQRVHRVQVYKCTECDKIFKQVSSLKAHHRIHTGERPYKCTQCEKSFNHASSFTIHQRTHTGNRPYKCSECDKRFSNKSNLLKHERIHSRVRPYQCLDCTQSFTYKSHLLIHQISHSGERPQ
ncbi:zinc finger protein 37A-like isoform X2 [Pleurodeles waltl]|uniref:zinc finger protein 37A-like isoform X2 n=1 Tax=Pleurodeles waltl TaxID=8319 RepID=UPI0037097661